MEQVSTDGLLEPFERRIPSTRNGTELSRLCDGLLAEFVSGGMAQARVLVEKTRFPADAVYRALWSAGNKREFAGRVAVRKVDGEVLLVRRERKL